MVAFLNSLRITDLEPASGSIYQQEENHDEVQYPDCG
jgi:hypothetical protein